MTFPTTHPGAVMKILTGPPGTGKTYRAVREAVRAIEPDIAEDEIPVRHHQLVEAGRILWVTFHPSYTYEDFVEGIRPTPSQNGVVNFKVVPGVFRRACEKCRQVGNFNVGDRLGKYEVLQIFKDGLVLSSIASRDDAVSEDSAEGFADYWTINRAIERGLRPADFSVPGKQNDKKKQLAERVGFPTTFWNNSGRHRALWDALELQRQNASTLRHAVVLVIDEINRADLSRVFGELMTLLELDKREGEVEEKRITLPYSGEQFTVPATLSIIGTMNTADRSLAVLDYALRRRFTFIEVMPEPERCAGNYGGLNLGAYLIWMNRVLTALLSRDNQIGHVDLMESRLEKVREQENYADDNDGRLRATAWTIRHKLAPLLLEYFHEDWRLASRVLGEQTGDALLKSQDYSDIAALDSNLDIRSSYEFDDWWNPDGTSWCGSRFRAYMLAIKDVGVPVAVAPSPSTGAIPATPTVLTAPAGTTLPASAAHGAPAIPSTSPGTAPASATPAGVTVATGPAVPSPASQPSPAVPVTPEPIVPDEE